MNRLGGQHEKAWQILLEIEPAVREIGFPREMMRLELNKAEILRERGEIKEALTINEEVADRALLQGDEQMRLYAISNGALCRVHLGEPEQADKEFQQVADDPHSGSTEEILPNAIYNRGWLRICGGRWEEAKPYLARAADLYSTRGDNDRAGRAWSLYAWADLRLGNVENAIHVARKTEEKGLTLLRMLEYALKQLPTPAGTATANINAIFRDEPDQRSLLLLWLCEGVPQNETEQSPVLQACHDAITQAHNLTFKNVLERTLLEKGLTIPSPSPTLPS